MNFGAAAAKMASGEAHGANGDLEEGGREGEEEGFSRGRGRGKGRDGGEYEMVGMNGSAHGRS